MSHFFSQQARGYSYADKRGGETHSIRGFFRFSGKLQKNTNLVSLKDYHITINAKNRAGACSPVYSGFSAMGPVTEGGCICVATVTNCVALGSRDDAFFRGFSRFCFFMGSIAVGFLIGFSTGAIVFRSGCFVDIMWKIFVGHLGSLFS